MNKTYCPYPFMSSSLQADNTVLPCGQFMKSIHFQKVIPIQEVRNSEFMNDMRQKMLDGKHVDGCQCPAEEAAGIRSMRQNAIDKYGFTTELKLRKLELTFDNICNLKCRSCATPNSHLWHADEEAIYGTTIIKNKFIENTIFEEIDFTDLEYIEVLGGEPMISPGTNKFFLKAKSLNILSNLNIQISTNGMLQPNATILTALLECKSLELTISIDAYGGYNNYVRGGSNWNDIVKNLDFYSTLFDKRKGNTKIAVHTAVSIYNVNQLELLDNFIITNYSKFVLTKQVVQFPIFLSIKNTAQDYKDSVRPHIKDSSIINYLDSNGTDMFAHFINFSNKLDEIRNESTSGNPLLAEYVANYKHKVPDSRTFFLKSINDIKN
jgi:organic radical activating enzyme